MRLARRMVPTAVVRGVQLAVGLQLSEKGLQAVWFTDSQARPAGRRSWRYRAGRVKTDGSRRKPASAAAASPSWCRGARKAIQGAGSLLTRPGPAVAQERDLQAGLPRGLLPSSSGGDDEREVESTHLVYLGLAAAAFLLLTLYPDAPAGGGSPKAALPLAHSGALSASGERTGAVHLSVFTLAVVGCAGGTKWERVLAGVLDVWLRTRGRALFSVLWPVPLTHRAVNSV